MGIFQQFLDSFIKLDLKHNAIMMNFRSILAALGLIRSTLRFSEDGKTVIGYYGSPHHIVIPESVTKIGEKAFKGRRRLTSIVIPKSVTKIGNGAFSRCRGLTSIVIPESVTKIGNGAFKGCSGLNSIEILGSVKKIGDNAFEGCSGLTSIEIPESVIEIGEYAFCACHGLTSIGKDAFEGRDNLTIHRNEKKEFEKQLLLAKQGDAEAQYLVSSYYYDAIGTKQNLSEADKWLKESAKNGFGPAYFMQAQFLEENDENGSKAEAVFSLYQKALDNGCTGACFPLGDMCLNGIGCEKSVEKAMKIFRVGIVEELKSDGDMNSLLNDLANLSEDMHPICKKAQSGDGDAFYQLGVFLWHKQE